MSTEQRPTAPSQEQLPQDDFADEPLVAETEPQVDGSERALVYPADASEHEAATQWLAVPADQLVDVEDVR